MRHRSAPRGPRRTVHAPWPAIGAGAIVQAANGGGAFIKESGHPLRNDLRYASRAQRVRKTARDTFEGWATEPLEPLQANLARADTVNYPLPDASERRRTHATG
ncbi:hypothetical protein A6V36_29195 [Paraburkholderia ginsengiterrae]|uniref:Uncharacterized protein n=1 Tax=Paraburkholderia ginsengiterrae TaxID=1462993 RepID=A0A1A9MYV3_9BURK|nr:hypothetical protein A6V37_08340 [Paraburkholderia ginsengiterrae]OAJ58865.1 hypothetical protein A6V36_29195 [Paraburkholderia ginsengiterrae]